jgi:hypothetical protein
VRRPRTRRAAAVEEEETPERASGSSSIAQPSTFELSVGPRAVYRQLSYLSDPNDALSEFRTARPAPALGASLSWFFRLAFPRLGLQASAEQALGLQATTRSDLTYNTFSGDYNAALVVGVPSRYLAVDLALGGGRQRFAFTPQGDAISRPRPIPNVTYDYLRAGLDVHVYTGTRFAILAGGYYRHVLSAGLIRSADWYPSARVWGLEANLGVSYRLLPWLEARLRGDLRLYQFTMDPRAGDAHVTDGATDQYWTGSLSLAALFGGGR